jgi:HAD superfamily phosphatase (TIGR01668 family)
MFLQSTYIIDGDVTDIDLEELTRAGIRGLIFDLDSTLVAPHSGLLTEEVARWLKQARDNFQVAVVSNNKRDAYIQEVAVLLDMHCVGWAAKPSTKAFKAVQERFQLAPHEVAVIGDRPLTDVWGGLRAGMKTILVMPLKTMNEPEWIKMFRRLERIVLKKIN